MRFGKFLTRATIYEKKVAQPIEDLMNYKLFLFKQKPS